MKIIERLGIDELWEINPDLIDRISKTLSPEFVRHLVKEFGVFSKEEYDNYIDSSGIQGHFYDWLKIKLQSQLAPIYYHLNESIENRRILDLGCGSHSGTYESREFKPQTWEPWLCRALLSLGANPIGIDIGDLSKERFEHYQANLLSENSLEMILPHSVDIANAELLYDSPTLEEMWGSRNLRSLLLPQLERVVNPNGYFIENT